MSDEVRKLLHISMRNYEEWKRFNAKVDELLRRGLLQPITPLWVIYLPSEEWYLDPSDGEIYVYLKPDDRIRPEWERVDAFAPPKITESRDIRVGGLGLIKPGVIRRETADFLKPLLESLAEEGQIEILPKPELPCETWFREYLTDGIYRLISDDRTQDYRWERAPANDQEHSAVKPN